MTVIIYTYPPDYHMAGVSSRMLAERQGLKVVLAIDAASPAFACEFASVVRTPFDRKGNLNGLEFLKGHLRLMAEHASGDYTIKLDSDTALIDARRLIANRNETITGLWVDQLGGMNGCCYAIRTAELPAMIRAADELSELEYHMEDHSTGRLALATGSGHFSRWEEPEANLYTPWRGEQAADSYRGKAVVCWEVMPDSDRRRIAREMKALYQS